MRLKKHQAFFFGSHKRPKNYKRLRDTACACRKQIPNASKGSICFCVQTAARCVLPTPSRPSHWRPHRKRFAILFRIAFFQNLRCFVLYNFDDFTLRRENFLCRIATTPNHYVRSAFQCSRGVATSQKEHATVL